MLPIDPDFAGPSGYLVAPAGGAEWASLPNSITLSDSDNVQLSSIV